MRPNLKTWTWTQQNCFFGNKLSKVLILMSVANEFIEQIMHFRHVFSTTNVMIVSARSYCRNFQLIRS